MNRRYSIPFILCLIAILLSVVVLYARSLFFGFIWDDPVFYGHVGQTWWRMLLPTAEYQFYRPLTMLYFGFFRRMDGTFAAEVMHGFQIAFHLINVVLAYAIARHLGLEKGTAVTVAAFFAFFPFSHQAVAWAVPHHPLTAVLLQSAWLAYIVARPLDRPPISRARLWQAVSLVLFLMALAVQENSITMAIVPLLYEFIVRRSSSAGNLRAYHWSLVYLLAAAIYLFIWLFIPRQAGLTGAFFDFRNLPYFLQGVAFPAFFRPSGYAADTMWTAPPVAVVSIVVIVANFALAAWRKRGRVSLFGLAWVIAGVAPMLIGLDYDYVSLGPRLLYTAAPGVALFWGCGLYPRRTERLVIRVASFGVIGIIVLQSVWLLWQFQQEWQAGTDHLTEALTVLDETDEGRLLFLNFPDRYTPKQEPFPLGYWGLTLAPVVMELAEFQAILTGGATASLSRSMPWVGQAGRENGPYQVDMRGVIIQPEELAALADEVEAIYMSDYLPDGRFQLHRAGNLLPGAAPSCELARFSDAICLHNVQVTAVDGVCAITLVWSTAETLPPHLTIFTHLGVQGQPPVAQADGDTWRGALPLANWPTQTQIVDERTLPCPAEPGDMAVQIGVYNWVDGTRLPGVAVEEARPLPDDAWRMDVGGVGR